MDSGNETLFSEDSSPDSAPPPSPSSGRGSQQPTPAPTPPHITSSLSKVTILYPYALLLLFYIVADTTSEYVYARTTTSSEPFSTPSDVCLCARLLVETVASRVSQSMALIDNVPETKYNTAAMSYRPFIVVACVCSRQRRGVRTPQIGIRS